jgi:large subunit ribosomal protein L21
MYAIIRAGGKQAKVREGDVLSVERIKDKDTVSFTPLLVVSDDGTVISDKDALAKATVTAEVLGESAGPKVDIFKYKAKTGYRRRQGHRQKYTTIKVTGIATGMKKAAKSSKPDAETADTEKADKPATAAKADKPAAAAKADKPAAAAKAEKPAAAAKADKPAAAAKPKKTVKTTEEE